jgi:hypothetical protein
MLKFAHNRRCRTGDTFSRKKSRVDEAEGNLRDVPPEQTRTVVSTSLISRSSRVFDISCNFS